MPAWVKDEDIWNKARLAFKKQYKKEPKDNTDFAIVTSIYKQMGGKISGEAKEMAKMFKFTILKEEAENDVKSTLQSSGNIDEENKKEDVRTLHINKGEEKMNYAERLINLLEAVIKNKNYKVIKSFKAQNVDTGRDDIFSIDDDNLYVDNIDNVAVEFTWNRRDMFIADRKVFEKSTKLQ